MEFLELSKQELSILVGVLGNLSTPQMNEMINVKENNELLDEHKIYYTNYNDLPFELYKKLAELYEKLPELHEK